MTLEQLNSSSKQEQKEAFFKCCGCSSWAEQMIALSPFETVEEITEQAALIWRKCTKEDWLEAFTHHPKIGDIENLKKKFAATAQWASGEQSAATTASQTTLEALAKGNDAYEKKFGFIFIVCATGKSAEEMLTLLLFRLPNTIEDEIKIAAEEQYKIMMLRLDKLLA